MNGCYDNEYGKVVIDNRVIARIAGMTALECVGIVGMAAVSARDGIVKLLKRDSTPKGIKVEAAQDGVALIFHIIVAYGANIPVVTENLVSNVRYAVESVTGFNVSRIDVYVEGVRVID